MGYEKVNDKESLIIKIVNECPGKIAPLIRCLACFEGDISSSEFDLLVLGLIEQQKIVITVDENDYVRYSPGY
jgi:hypothetical protein